MVQHRHYRDNVVGDHLDGQPFGLDEVDLVLDFRRGGLPLPKAGRAQELVRTITGAAAGAETVTGGGTVVQALLEGQHYEDIAAALGREHGTVRSQAASVYSKLGVSSRGQAVRKALQLGIVHANE